MMLLDSFAWMEYFMGSKKGERVKQFVDDNVQLYTCPIVIAEIYSKSLRTDRNGKVRTDFIMKRCALITIDADIAVNTAEIHAENKAVHSDFGLADAFILACARSRKLKVMTGDIHFAHFEDSIML